MKDKSKVQMFMGNIIVAFLSQGISLFLSIFMSLVVPKILGVTEFGYWQLFIFYIGYVGFFHIGLNDGIYLKMGGKKYNDLDFSELSSQFLLALVIQILFAIVIILYSRFLIVDYQRKFILYMTAIYLVITNMSNFLGCIFQATNRVKVYSLSVIIDKILFMLAVCSIILLKINRFEIFVILYTLCQSISFMYTIFKGRKIICSKMKSIITGFKLMFENISIGINLMLSNIASSLILGIGRFMIDQKWGIEEFGKFSFALSLTNFFLLFINQVSMVLFPMLRTIDKEKQEKLYIFSRNILGIVLSGVLLFYIPIKSILVLWLPKYEVSLKYLALLLPLCTFNGKMQMLCNTYLKVFRKERVLLRINIISVAISFILCFIGVKVFENILSVIIFMVIAVAFRSYIAEIYLGKQMNIQVVKSMIYESALVMLFTISTWFYDSYIGFSLYLFCYLVYLFLMRDEIIGVISYSKKIFIRKTV